MVFSGLHRNIARCISLLGKSCNYLQKTSVLQENYMGYLKQCLCHSVSRLQQFSEIITFLTERMLSKFDTIIFNKGFSSVDRNRAGFSPAKLGLGMGTIAHPIFKQVSELRWCLGAVGHIEQKTCLNTLFFFCLQLLT